MVRILRNIRPPTSLNLLELREWYKSNLGWIPRKWKNYISVEEANAEPQAEKARAKRQKVDD